MASCVKCTLIDKLSDEREPIGVCSVCSSLACHMHGTLMQRADRFKCIFCLPREFLDSSGLAVIHEVGDGPPDGGGGGVGAGSDPEPGPGGGGSGSTPEFLPGELEELYEDLAGATREHRDFWHAEIDGIVGKALAFADGESVRGSLLERTTSHPEAVEELDRIGTDVARALENAQVSGALDREMLADGLGVAAWAIGEPPGAQPSVDRIRLLTDERVRYFIRYYAPVRETAGSADF